MPRRRIWRRRCNCMAVQVQCYAGRKAGERPVRFRIGARDYTVEAVLEQRYGPEYSFFRVRADNNEVYLLRLEPARSIWTLERLPNRP